MQFVSDTAEKVAGEVGRNNFRQDDLYDPATSILFGSQYIADLFNQFPNQPAAVAASYNGGSDNMVRWLTRSKIQLYGPVRFRNTVPQSKDYVGRVMANYRMYQLYTTRICGRDNDRGFANRGGLNQDCPLQLCIDFDHFTALLITVSCKPAMQAPAETAPADAKHYRSQVRSFRLTVPPRKQRSTMAKFPAIWKP